VVTLDASLLKILACPVDKGSLLYFRNEMVLYNPRLRRRYRVTEGIPVMLAAEAEHVSEAEHARLIQLASTSGAVSTLS
jgi:uncharacterized protein